MANHHYGKVADVWKHLVLCEVLDGVRPSRYAETHAGSGAYPLVRDPERGYGVLGLLDGLEASPVLAGTSYAGVVRRFVDARPSLYPGSALQAMELLGAGAAYQLCDLDPDSAESLRGWAHRLDAAGCEVLERDGMAATREWLAGGAGEAVVHIDPFDPFAHDDGSPSAVGLAAEVARSDDLLVYWYGYSRADERAWALEEIGAAAGRSLWCGDVLVTTADGDAREDGDLGEATTPGTGFGVVLANVPPGVQRRCEDLGRALQRHYESRPLPSGEPGALHFEARVSAPSGSMLGER